MWDSDYLYVIAIVQDDILQADAPNGNDAWQDDSIELYIDGGNEKCASCYDDNDAQYRFRPGIPDGEPPLMHNDAADGIEWTAGVPEEGGGYVIEVAIPWTKNSVVAQTNTVIGFDVHVNDDDEGGATRDGKLHWTDSPGDNQHNSADYFGTVTLIGGGGANVAVASIRRTPSGGVREGVEIEFNGTMSTAPGAIESFAWDFGDGNSASGEIVTHTFEAVGSYVVSLTVTDEGGVSGSSEQTIKVYSSVGTADNPLEIPRATADPVIDGEMDAAYESAQQVQLLNRANGSEPDSEEDLSVTAYMMWSDDNLYVFYDVLDDILSNDSGNTWEDDAAELYIDGGNEKNPGPDPGYDDNDIQYELGWGTTTVTGNSSANADGVEFVVLDKDDGSGYHIEVLVPWERAAVTPEVGLEIGFELMINDDDSPEDSVGSRASKLSWFATDGQDVAYQDPSVFGTALLVEELGTAAEAPSELPGGFAIQSVYPNPFNPSATALVRVEQPGDYTLTVYNVLGQQVLRETLSVQAVGEMNVSLDLRDQASGMYLFSLQNKATGKIATSRALLLK